ncbi:MAG TPA: hypothetical protein VFH68_15720 [Polyangia bacterium]|jgi:hypothetical protein|nr:hypothetical protein [Polyangia bacterium]
MTTSTLRAGALLLAVTTGTLVGCRDQQSFLVVNVQSADAAPITGVVALIVTVTNGGDSTVLTYPTPPGQTPLTITGTFDPVTKDIGKTLSVSFSMSHSDDVLVEIDARNAAACTIGHGANHTPIKKGGVGEVIVALDHTSGPCDADGGSDAGNTFPGCDPATLSCGTGMTCAVNCAAMQGQCVAAGATPGGGLCTRNADCAPGTQCFNYAGPSCNVGVCLKYCKTDNDCTNMGSLCQGNVPCASDGGTVLTSYHTCTFGCDPRGDATTGCPSGLHCFLVDTMDQVDCACTEATRTRNEGLPCTRGVDCAPGLICDKSTAKCQKICRIGAGATDCATGQSCVALTNDTLYGVCL